ncbi:EAL domain-containing protein [Marinicella meishanensis]|uniref:EAL domain-containing protein n=1 Tax=Marinicella meishanensis TaxID=2873263 RepID=UPI001CBDD795|nr:EAL domain-containing protein [Marinicella sp. NBU2979]
MKEFVHTVVALSLLIFQVTAHSQANNALKKTYRIGYFDTPPLQFRNDKLNQPDGLAIEILNKMAEEHGFTIDWVYGDFPDLMAMMKAKRLDALPSLGYSVQRSEFLDYPKTNFSNVWGQVFLSSDSKIESLFDLDGKTIALLENGVNGLNFINQCEQFEVDCRYVYGKSYAEVFQMVANKSADAAVSNNLAGLDFQQDYNLLVSSIIFNPFKVFVTTPKGTNAELLAAYDQTLGRWKQEPDSFYYQARSKWTLAQEDNTIPSWIWYSLLGLLIFGLVTMVAAVLFKRQVKYQVTKLMQREIQLNQVINIVPHMIFANDYEGKIILANENACQFFGIDKDDIESKNIYSILRSNANFENLINYTTSSNPFNTEVVAKDITGTTKTLMMSKVPYSGRQDLEPAMVTVGVDISQVKAYEEEILYMAHYDSLTDLPNRELLKDRLKSSLARAKQFNHVGGILHIDLDNFKNINDSQGHQVGDKLIKKVALRIKSCVGPGDTLARLGGDEFIIELPELKNELVTAEKQAIEVAGMVLKKLKQPIGIEGNHYHITASVGIVIYPRDGNHQSVLLQRADTAMFEAKIKGRNRIQVFEEGIESRVKKNHQLENDLRLALKNNEINVLYQPVVDAETETIVGSEVLLRWQHPTEGEIMPTEFIPIAEQAQLILEIGYWTIEEACKQIIKWKDRAQRPFFLAVNLSVIQIRDRNFLERVTALIHQYKIPKDYLEFEVTESILLSENQRSIEIINQLKLLGIKLSIDDFGTGYSSFDYIRKLPLDKIKIDKSFIKDVPADTSSTTIVKTILKMAEEMQLEVVAEGVETATQIAFLKQHHCQYFQGYYFSKPKTEAQLLAKHKL